MGMTIEGSDDLLFEELCKRLPRQGHFIEIGSRDGKDNSYKLAIKGWGGFCIEANPNVANYALKETYKNKPQVKTFNYCVTSKGGNVDFYVHKGVVNPGVSSVFKERVSGRDAGLDRPFHDAVSVPSISLTEFWLNQDEPSIDLLMMDTEGCDAEIILSTDFSDFKPKFILAETTFLYYYLNPRSLSNNIIVWEMINEHLSSFGYKLIIQNNCKEYKMRYFPELMDMPINSVWMSSSK